MMTIEFHGEHTGYIKQWLNWSGPIPVAGDTVLLHFGDFNEEEEEWVVIGRVISGTEPDKIKIIIFKK